MCLGLGHKTRECRDTNEGRLKVCHKKNDNDKECGGYHCGYLHFRQYKPTPASNLTVNETKDNNHSEPAVEEVKNWKLYPSNEKSDNKEWQVDDYCRALCDFDGQEHELQIIKQNPTIKEVFRVLVLGYGHKEIKNCNVLQQSRGENARKIQINAATQPQGTTFFLIVS